ncbi:MAG: hypothetical protein KF882_05260 [Bacteroidia bacterium]|nr:hypothetical protein [Bacteroidia bacterium]MCO5253058.1 hypothetical protein [Bacteroidota bacterium]
MKRIKRTMIYAVAFIAMISISATAFAQNPPKTKIDLHQTKVTPTRGSNPNIKVDRPTTDNATTSRGYGSSTCRIYLSNYTDFNIDIYVDGVWKGTLGAWDEAYVNTGSGYTTMYGISTGKTTEWKFEGANCQSSTTYNFY